MYSIGTNMEFACPDLYNLIARSLLPICVGGIFLGFNHGTTIYNREIEGIKDGTDLEGNLLVAFSITKTNASQLGSEMGNIFIREDVLIDIEAKYKIQGDSETK